jgi:hypothetical protein
MTTATLADRIWNGERVRVATPANCRFTIVRKMDRHGFGVRGFGVIPDGRKRPINGHRILSRSEIKNWADDLTEIR